MRLVDRCGCADCVEARLLTRHSGRICPGIIVWLTLGFMLVSAGCSAPDSASPPTSSAASPDGGLAAGDAGGTLEHEGGLRYGSEVISRDVFAAKVAFYTKGACGGFGANALPDVVLGPPRGAGTIMGSLDVVSLGAGGSIVLELARPARDAPGVDFLVFENAFLVGGTQEVMAEPAEVSVSEDGTDWFTFPCTATAAPYGACAGWHPVMSKPGEISPLDVNAAGGDPFDLATIGVRRAKFVRIVDRGSNGCAQAGGPPTDKAGFDLDAIAIIHAE